MKFNMFPQKVLVDASQASGEHVVLAPGALIDLATDPARGQNGQASASVLEPKFGYDQRYEHAVRRLRGDMFDLMSVPEASVELLRGFAASGKAMRAAYWGLTCRCEEKWAEWDDALKWMARRLVEMAGVYGAAALPEIEYSVKNRAPVPDPGRRGGRNAQGICARWRTERAAAWGTSGNGSRTPTRRESSDRSSRSGGFRRGFTMGSVDWEGARNGRAGNAHGAGRRRRNGKADCGTGRDRCGFGVAAESMERPAG